MTPRRFHSDGSLCRAESEPCPAVGAHRDCLVSALDALDQPHLEAHGALDYTAMDALEMLRLGAHSREILRVIWNSDEPTEEERLKLYNLLESRSQLHHVVAVLESDGGDGGESLHRPKFRY